MLFPRTASKLAVLFALALLYLATPLKAQNDNQRKEMLQYVIELSELEQLYESLEIRDSLHVVQTSALPSKLELRKFGRRVAVITPEDGYYRKLAYAEFTSISASDSSETSVTAKVAGPHTKAGEAVDISLVLKQQSEGWTLERFRRAS